MNMQIRERKLRKARGASFLMIVKNPTLPLFVLVTALIPSVVWISVAVVLLWTELGSA
jgi:hypothetical protein